MDRRLSPALLLCLCALLLSSCFMPLVASQQPFYPEGDAGEAVPGLANKWISPNNETLTIAHDDYAGGAGDYLFTFTMPPLPEPGGDANAPAPLPPPLPEPGDQSPTPAGKGDYAEMVQGHVFEVDGQTYCDFSIPAPLPEPGAGDKPKPEAVPAGPGQPGGHVLCRLELGLGQIALQVMDMKWFMDHSGELKTATVKIKEGEEQATPLLADSRENIWSFIRRHQNDGLWGTSASFGKALVEAQ